MKNENPFLLAAFLMLSVLGVSLYAGLGGSAVGGTEASGGSGGGATGVTSVSGAPFSISEAGVLTVPVVITNATGTGVSVANGIVTVVGGGGGGASTNNFVSWGFAAYGSSDLSIPRPKSYRLTGTAWLTVTTNATEGAKYTILQNGIYYLGGAQGAATGAAAQFGVSTNAAAADLDIAIESVAASGSSNAVICWNYNAAVAGSSSDAHSSGTIFVYSNTVVRPHASTSVPSNADTANFRIQQISTGP